MVEENKYLAHWVIFVSCFLQAFLDCRGSTVDDVSPSPWYRLMGIQSWSNPAWTLFTQKSLLANPEFTKEWWIWYSTEAMKQIYRLNRRPVKMFLKLFYHPRLEIVKPSQNREWTTRKLPLVKTASQTLLGNRGGNSNSRLK
jgi:hypothetical protein